MLFENLKKHKKIPFHIPGHKRNTNLLNNELPYSIDITEIEDFDNLHNPKTVIKQIELDLKSVYNCEHSFLLVNGSTCGILTAIYTVLKEGDTVLVARNCHKSVYNAIRLVKANTVYIQPQFDEFGIAGKISCDDIKLALDNNAVNLVVITSPTYEGIISDIDIICDLAHSKGVPVLLDSAHGAHYFEKSKADIVVMSLHKTLPALTQCAIVNINGDLVDAEQFRINLSIFETSSPSYVLMSSIEMCVEFINNNKTIFRTHNDYINKFYNNLQNLKYLKLVKYDDICKIIVFTGNSSLSGAMLSDILRNRYNIEVEMVSKDYIVAVTTVCDSDENLCKFKDALLEIDSQLNYGDFKKCIFDEIPEKYCETHNITSKGFLYPLDKVLNKISSEYVWVYPPGIPILLPGEIISEKILQYILNFKEDGIKVHSTYSKLPYGLYCKE